jgi:hypothetical protein
MNLSACSGVLPTSAHSSKASIWRNPSNTRPLPRSGRRCSSFVSFFSHDKHITGAQHLEFAAHFGELDTPHPVFENDALDPRLTIIESKGRAHDDEHYWHTDVTYQQAPAFGSILTAKKIPESGGDTLFALDLSCNVNASTDLIGTNFPHERHAQAIDGFLRGCCRF